MARYATEMIVNPVLQPVVNGTVYWLPSDTEELYNKNLNDANKRQMLDEYNWVNSSISYTFNSEGFRSSEFTSNIPAIAVFGCSHTQGTGLHYYQVWHQRLGSMLNKPVFNFGIGGASADTCYRLAEHYLPKLNVDMVVMLSPSIYRLEFWDTNSSFPMFLNINSIPDNHKFFKPWFVDKRNAQINAVKNIQSIAYLCKMLNVDFYCFNESQYINCLNGKRSYARDLLHSGEEHNIEFSKIVATAIQNKAVYCPHWLNRAQPPRS